MSLKDAVTHSLLMFVAAACVVLIVKAIAPPVPAPQGAGNAQPASSDSAVRTTGGTPTLASPDAAIVYYFHGKIRCPTCQNIEAYTQEAIATAFGDLLERQQLQWRVVNYEEPGNEHFATDYELACPSVVLVKRRGGKPAEWKSLPEVWELVGDKPAFLAFIQKSVRDFLDGRLAQR